MASFLPGGNVGIGTTNPNPLGSAIATYLAVSGTGSTYQQEGRLELVNPKASAASGDYGGTVHFTERGQFPETSGRRR